MIGRLRVVVGLVGWAALSLAVFSGCRRDASRADAEVRPNVLLITLDTLRKSRLSCYGCPLPTSPEMDALAGEGIRFDFAIAQAGVTPVSHASILTGLNPFSHGVRVVHAASGYALPRTVPSLTSILHDAGWATGAFLSSFTVSERFGFEYGFDVFDNGLSGGADDKLKPNTGGFWMWDVRGNQRRSDETASRAIAWMSKARRPFFAWVHFWDPHDQDITPPPDVVRRFLTPGSGKMERYLQVYDAEVCFVDQQVGRLIKALQGADQYANTIVVVIADHGEGLDDGLRNHKWFRHRMLYQEQIGVPFILRIPGGPKGRVVAELVRSIDILPTVLDYLGLPAAHPVEGVSLRPLIAGEPDGRRMAYADALNLFDLNAEMIRERPDADLLYCAMDDEWKLIYRSRRPEASELYHLKNDPGELRNLYRERPAEAGRLVAWLEGQNCFVDSPFPPQGAADDRGQQEAFERLRTLGYIGGGGARWEHEPVGTNGAEPGAGENRPDD